MNNSLKNAIVIVGGTVCSLMNTSVHAQVTVATNAIAAGNYVGTSNAFDVIFKVNALERMHLTQNGNLTMGSSNALGPMNTYSTALGESNNSTGNSSFTAGYNNTASGYTAIALNSDNVASGDRALAAGYSTRAEGIRSFTSGDATVAHGQSSAAFNYNTNAESYAETVFGRYNVTSELYTDDSWVGGDPLFVIGNGTSTLTPSNAVTVLKNGNVGIGYDNPTTAGVLLDVNGGVRGTTAYQISDLRYKKLITPVSGALEKVMKLNGVTYNWRCDEFPKINFDDRRQIGFIAQQLKDVLPEAVSEDAEGYYSISYTSVIPILSEAIKEQQGVIATQEERILRQGSELGELRSRLARMEDMLSSGSGVSPDARISSTALLSQNNPNPADETTTISYILPSPAANARLVLTEAGSGREVGSYELGEGGGGSVKIRVRDLPAGGYIYTIVLDGKILQSRRMIVVK